MQNAEFLDSERSNADEEAVSRVLVVDDVPTNRTVLKSLLSRPTCEVFEAEDGHQAIEIVDKVDLEPACRWCILYVVHEVAGFINLGP